VDAQNYPVCIWAVMTTIITIFDSSQGIGTGIFRELFSWQLSAKVLMANIYRWI